MTDVGPGAATRYLGRVVGGLEGRRVRVAGRVGDQIDDQPQNVPLVAHESMRSRSTCSSLSARRASFWPTRIE
jgi:hypothetical protein